MVKIIKILVKWFKEGLRVDPEGNIFGDYDEEMDIFNRWCEGILLHLCNYNGLAGLREWVQKGAAKGLEKLIHS